MEEKKVEERIWYSSCCNADLFPLTLMPLTALKMETSSYKILSNGWIIPFTFCPLYGNKITLKFYPILPHI